VSGSSGNNLLTLSRQEFYTGVPLESLTVFYTSSENYFDVCNSPFSVLFSSTPTLQTGTILYINSTGDLLTGARYVCASPRTGEIIYAIDFNTGEVGNEVGSSCA
jgi:hypothetical protein